MSYFSSTRRYRSGDCVRIPELGLCRVVCGTYVRGMYHYTVYGL
jgi:hypothetical protein